MKIIVRIKGGLGNQLYCYAAARRLAVANNAELVVDDVSGFKRDYQYQRKYMLDFFNIPSRKASVYERLEPFERIRRGIIKKIESRKLFENRSYIEQEFDDFDKRIINIKISKNTYIDGLWQSLKYFEDIEELIRQDLTMKSPTDEKNLLTAIEINGSNSVAVHVRWFEDNANNSTSNTNSNYYKKALEKAEELLEEPHYFVFSDNPIAAKSKIDFPSDRVTFVSHNNEDEKNAIWDFWLMRQCKNFIIANSTFSWWAAWLGADTNKSLVAFPRLSNEDKLKWAWDYEGQMPKNWLPIQL